MRFSTRKGFTLLELLVVFTLISMISGVSAVSYTQFLKQARMSKRKADLQQLKIALEMYRNNNGSYPRTSTTDGITYAFWGACSDFGSRTEYITGLIPEYMQPLPRDPKESVANTGLNANCTASKVCYIYKSDGINYKLVANCGAEIPINVNDSFYGPGYPIPNATPPASYGLQVATKGGYDW